MTVLIDCASEIMVLTLDRQHDLVEMPFVALLWLTSAQLIGKLLAESQRPLPDRLIGNDDASAGHQFLNVAKAQREPEVEPHYVADDLTRVAEAALKLETCHPCILSRRGRLRQLDSARQTAISKASINRPLTDQILTSKVSMESKRITESAMLVVIHSARC